MTSSREMMQALLAKQLQAQNNTMISPWAGVGKMALAAALARQNKLADSEQKQKQKQLAAALGNMQAQSAMGGGTGMFRDPAARQAQGASDMTALTGDPMETLKMQQLLRGSKEERKTERGADGYLYYTDTKERVFPGVQKEEKPKTVLKRTNALNKETGETYGIVDYTDGTMEVSDPFIGVGVQAGNVDSTGLSKTAQDKIVDQIGASRVALDTIERIEQQIGSGGNTILGLVGTGVRFADASLDQLDAAANALYGSKVAEIGGKPATRKQLENSILSNAEFWGGSKDLAALSAATQSNLISLAYAIARSEDEGGRLSESDVKQAMQQIVAGNVNQTMAKLGEAKRRILMRAKVVYEGYNKTPFEESQEFKDWFSKYQGGGGYTPPNKPVAEWSDEELAEFEANQ